MSTKEDRKRREVEIGLANNAFGATAGTVATVQARSAWKRKAAELAARPGGVDAALSASRTGRMVRRLHLSPGRAIAVAGGLNVAGQAANGLLDAQSAHYFARERLAMGQKKVAKAAGPKTLARAQELVERSKTGRLGQRTFRQREIAPRAQAILDRSNPRWPRDSAAYDDLFDRSQRKSRNFVERLGWDPVDHSRRLAVPGKPTSLPRQRSLTPDAREYLGLDSAPGIRQGTGGHRPGKIDYELTGNKRVRKASFDPYTGQMTSTGRGKPANAALYGGVGAGAGAGAGLAAKKWLPQAAKKGRHVLPKAAGRFTKPAALALGGVGAGMGVSKGLPKIGLPSKAQIAGMSDDQLEKIVERLFLRGSASKPKRPPLKETPIVFKAEEAVVSRVEGQRNGAGRRITEVSKARRFDAEADRQRRLGAASGLGLGGAALLGNEAYRTLRPEMRVTGDAGKKALSLPAKAKGKKGVFLAAGSLASGAVGIGAARRGVSERNQPWT